MRNIRAVFNSAIKTKIASMKENPFKSYIISRLKSRKTSVLNYYGKRLNKIALECGIKTKLNFYTARHTFATLSLKKGLSTVMIKQGLGHQSIQTTEAYLEDFCTEELDIAFEDIM